MLRPSSGSDGELLCSIPSDKTIKKFDFLLFLFTGNLLMKLFMTIFILTFYVFLRGVYISPAAGMVYMVGF